MSEQIIRTVEAMREAGPRVNLMDQRVLVANLVFLYQVIVASENLMEIALIESRDTALSQYLQRHAPEEKDHAKWLRKDLLTVGIDPDEAQLIRAAAELVGTQYYLIHHRNPNALLGYMAVLEGFPLPLPVLEQLEKLHGKDLLRCLRFHAIHDQEHRIELFRVIDELDDVDIYQNAVRTQFLINEASKQLC